MSNYLLVVLFSVTSISGNLLSKNVFNCYYFLSLIYFFSFNNLEYAILLLIVISFLSDWCVMHTFNFSSSFFNASNSARRTVLNLDGFY